MNQALTSRVHAANTALIGNGEFDAVGEYFHPDYVAHLTEHDMAGGHEGIRGYLGLLRAAFPDLQVEVEILLESESRVAWQRTLRGTHQGDFMGFPASGQPIVWRDMLTSRFEGGLIVEGWAISELAERLLLEVGCGTGHWLSCLRGFGGHAIGLDPSANMLHEASNRGRGPVARGCAEHLPFPALSFDHVVVVNATHHFTSPAEFVREARRILRPGGQLAVFGLDPSQDGDDWFVYEYFGSTRARDQARYPSTTALLGWFVEAGLSDCTARSSCQIRYRESGQEFLRRGRLAKEATSQLVLLSDEDFDEGRRRIAADAAAAKQRGASLDLRADLTLFGTFGRRAP